MSVLFDLVIPVYNSMEHVRACIESVFKHSTVDFHLSIVNDGSEPYVNSEIEKLLSQYDTDLYTYYHQENKGYLRTCNLGISQGNNPYVVLINSDTIMTPGYLEKVRDTFTQDKSIGIINPVSTWANWTRIPFPDGHNIHELHELVDERNEGVTDLYNASGFFFAVRRSLFDELGLFDEAYNHGYYEESDFCMRVLQAGYRVVVDRSLYIFHHGWGSFGAEKRNAHMERNAQIFFKCWKDTYQSFEEKWNENSPLASLNDYLGEDGLWKEKRSHSGAEVSSEKITELLDSLRKEKFCFNVPERKVSDKPRIIYILPAIKLYGGIVSVIQIVNRLILAGVNANVAVYGQIDQEIFRAYPFYFRPYVYPDLENMIHDFPECDLVVATHWETAYAAVALECLRGIKTAYFVQDFEPDFYCKNICHEKRRLAELTYSYIPNKIVKTHWLKNKISCYPGEVEIIPLGLNLDCFHDVGKNKELQVIGYGRPSSPYRNFSMLTEVFTEIYRRRPDIKLAVFGKGYSQNDFLCPIHDYGHLTRMEDVVAAVGESIVLLDCSTFQGFGRPGLEAMACGTAAVLTRVGGITEYAKHEYNALLIDPHNCEDIVSRVLELVDNNEKRQTLIARGYKTSAQFSYLAEGEKTARYLYGLLKDREEVADTGDGFLSIPS